MFAWTPPGSPPRITAKSSVAGYAAANEGATPAVIISAAMASSSLGIAHPFQLPAWLGRFFPPVATKLTQSPWFLKTP
jgi:hypothetical protein